MQENPKRGKSRKKDKIIVEENIDNSIIQTNNLIEQENLNVIEQTKSKRKTANQRKGTSSLKETKVEPNEIILEIKEKEVDIINDNVIKKTKETEKKISNRKTSGVKRTVKSKAVKVQEVNLNKIEETELSSKVNEIQSKNNESKSEDTKKTARSKTSREKKASKETTAKAASRTKKIATSKKATGIQSKDLKSISEPAKNSTNEITNFNTYLFHQGKNYESYNILGSHVRTEKRKKGVQFATWAPNAKDVYVVGDFNGFEVNDEFKLEKITENGLWRGFFTEAKVGDKYKYCIIEENGNKGEYKADPYGIQTELRPNNASIIYQPKEFIWNDKDWTDRRNKINVLEQPLNVYEVHLGSWKTNKDGGFLTYDQIQEELPKYVKEMGYTHIEIMPLVEHPLDASWGYQGTGYYSPTSRYGNLEGLKNLINKLHEENIGVIMDWVPGHFCKDSHGLYKFDGTPTYEYQDEWRAENKGWGTCNFDLGRAEVKSYLISNALYWFREFHIDGLRVDAVSSILYLDYSRSHGEWVPNKYGGNGNLEAIDFLKELNRAVFEEYPTALMIAEESTAWPNVTKPAKYDGLGFNMKWNMGWMNDTLEYVHIDPKYRKHNHKNVTFAMMYNYAENYLLPLSHDEVVHGKKSLLNKMWGDEWNKFAGLRAFAGYMMGHPGKKLLFMGCEFAQGIEWREYSELEWNLIHELKMHKYTQLYFQDLNKLYLENKAFWELDHDYKGFNWIEADNNEQSILIFARRSRDDKDTLIFIINFKPTVYYDYRIGIPFLGKYKEVFNSDNSKYGGSGQVMDEILIAEKEAFHNQPYSIKIKVPPMATLILKVNEITMDSDKNPVSELDKLDEHIN